MPATPWGQEAKVFGHQTLRDNVALLDDQLLQQINARIAAAGREVFAKKDGALICWSSWSRSGRYHARCAQSHNRQVQPGNSNSACVWKYHQCERGKQAYLQPDGDCHQAYLA